MPRTSNRIELRVSNASRQFEGNALAVITPGMLIERVGVTHPDKPGLSDVQPNTEAGVANVELLVAREEAHIGMGSGGLGKSVDDDYEIGDKVMYTGFAANDTINCLLATGQNIVKNAWLTSNGDGYWRVAANAAERMVKAIEAVDATAGPALCGAYVVK